MFLYLSSDHCKDTYPENEPQNFTVDLPQTLRLQGEWSLGLLQVHIKSPKPINKHVYIACNIIVNSYVGRECYRILKYFKVDKNLMAQDFGPVQYVAVENTGYINSITLQLLDSNNMLPASFVIEKLTCTLHLKRDKFPGLI
jgi:Ca2+-dependent lipid-binding protein